MKSHLLSSVLRDGFLQMRPQVLSDRLGFAECRLAVCHSAACVTGETDLFDFGFAKMPCIGRGHAAISAGMGFGGHHRCTKMSFVHSGPSAGTAGVYLFGRSRCLLLCCRFFRCSGALFLYCLLCCFCHNAILLSVCCVK